MEEIEHYHLIFIDDIKLVAESEETLVEMCQTTKDSLKMMGMKVNQQKSASSITHEAVFGDKVDDYKYLCVLEDSRSIISYKFLGNSEFTVLVHM